MSAPQPSMKSAVTVTEMAEMCQISRSRFYDLIESGVFPKPVQHPSTKARCMTEDCRKSVWKSDRPASGLTACPSCSTASRRKPAQPRPLRKPEPEKAPDHADLIDALKGLGLTASAQAVAEAVATLFPGGLAGLDHGDVIRKVFLHLQGGKK